jgi:hypothetical protein
MSDLIDYICRNEGAALLGISAKSLWRMDQKGLIPTPSVKILNVKTKREIVAYDRAIFLAWVKTNPVKHPGFQDPEKRRDRSRPVPTTANKEEIRDVWNIRSGKNRKNFEYSGQAKNIILFCQPKLLYRGLTFD